MKRRFFPIVLITMTLTSGLLLFGSMVWGAEPLKYSCSNQIYEAIEGEKIAAFTKATGIDVKTFRASSTSSVYRLMNGFSDIASSAQSLHPEHQDYGFSQIAFGKDPIAVIAKKGCGVENLSEAQLQEIFSGKITNWADVGGKDMPIRVVVPGENTAANKNFTRYVMKGEELRYYIAAYDSTSVLEIVNNFPCGSISFISGGASAKYERIRTIRINGLQPKDENYPYYQVLYYILKGTPSEAVNEFVAFSFSETGQALLRKNGLIPLARE